MTKICVIKYFFYIIRMKKEQRCFPFRYIVNITLKNTLQEILCLEIVYDKRFAYCCCSKVSTALCLGFFPSLLQVAEE